MVPPLNDRSWLLGKRGLLGAAGLTLFLHVEDLTSHDPRNSGLWWSMGFRANPKKYEAGWSTPLPWDFLAL